MNWKLISEKWTTLSSQLKAQWGKLTDEDLKEIGGSQEALTFKLQERYGFQRMDAEKKVANWGTAVTPNIETSPKLEREARPEEPSSKLTPQLDPRHESRDQTAPPSSAANKLP